MSLKEEAVVDTEKLFVLSNLKTPIEYSGGKTIRKGEEVCHHPGRWLEAFEKCKTVNLT
jgi:hypothetical protein